MPRESDIDAGRTARPIKRRAVVSGVAIGLCGGFLAGVTPASGDESGTRVRSNRAIQDTPGQNRLVQADDCVGLSPVTGDVPVEEFYKYAAGGTRYSSAGPITGLEEERKSRLLLYRGPDEPLSLVVVHGKHHIEDVPEGGGSVSFTFEGLPSDGEWVVHDDQYDGPEQFDEWEIDGDSTTVHWTWQGGRTDGAVFAGLGDDFSVTIEPRFNEEAKHYEEHYEGDVEAWEAIAGDLANPEATPLAMDEPVVIESNNC